MKICVRCDRAIQTGEKYTEHDKVSPSGGGATLYLHTKPCVPVPTQTAPVEN